MKLLRKLGAWHIFVSGPGFPEKPLYHQDLEFGSPSEVQILYGEHGHLKSIVGFNKKGDKSSCEFEYIKAEKKILVTLKKNDLAQLIVSEWYSNKVLYMRCNHPENPNLDTETRVSVVPDQKYIYEYDVEIDIGQKTIQGIINSASLDIPDIVIEFSKEITALQSNLTIAAFEPIFAGILTMEAYKNSYFIPLNSNFPSDDDLSNLLAIVGDVKGIFITALFYMANRYVLSLEEEEES
ncbi:MAG: hypothetical protein K0B81_09500 [Candidatus Cloacimonetes bacterium]|nr:hypothetical protein [Candidatus Cloacimonadota bacterium]